MKDCQQINVKIDCFMHAHTSTVKKRIARYIDAILFVCALLLISSVLEIIRL